MTEKLKKQDNRLEVHYESIPGEITNVIDTVRRSASRSVNCIMTAAYWLIGRRIVEFEQKGEARAGYGEKLLERLAQDLSTKYGRGFSYPNLNKFRQFYLAYPPEKILSTASIELGKQKSPTLSGESARRAQKHIPNAVSEKAQTLAAETDRTRKSLKASKDIALPPAGKNETDKDAKKKRVRPSFLTEFS
jgi:hypothetical protein